MFFLYKFFSCQRLNSRFTKYDFENVEKSMGVTKANIEVSGFENDELIEEFGENFMPSNLKMNPKDGTNKLMKAMEYLPYLKGFLDFLENKLK